MVLFNYSTKELTAKVVYYGPGLCGKTTNLQWIHEKLPIKNKGKMLSLATETDRTLFFDFLPIEIGTIRGMRTRIQLYTVPGQVFYNATRRMVLKGADAVCFVADSQEAMLDANLESYENMRQNLEANEIDPDEIPVVLQYNKRDLPNALPIEILNERLNPRSMPFFEAVAIKGLGVEETLKGVTQRVFRALSTKYGGADAGKPSPVTKPVAPTPAPTPAASTRPQAPPMSTLPPIQMQTPVEDADELLASLELQPAPEELVPSMPELGLDAPAALEDEIETLDIEDLGASDPPPPRASAAVGKTTLVSAQKETDELRRKIARPSMPDLNIEEMVEEDDQEIDELSFDAIPEAPAPRAPKPTAVSPRLPVTIPTLDAPLVSLQLPSTLAGQTEVSIPVELKVGEGSAQVAIRLRLTVSLKIQP